MPAVAVKQVLSRYMVNDKAGVPQPITTIKRAHEWAALTRACSRDTAGNIIRASEHGAAVGSLGFDVVDRIVCALDSPELWYQAPLKDHYWTGRPEPEFDIACELFA